MLKPAVTAIICLLFASTVAAKCLGDYPAPDKSVTVKVSALNKAEESLIKFFDAQGKLLHKEDYSSPDMDQGEVAYSCAWTPDSKFFVYSIYSSGGHQAWSFPTLFYARTDNKLHSLDDLVGSITDGDFTLKSPDVIETVGLADGKSPVQVIRKVGPDEPDVVFDVSLGQLLKNQHPSNPH